jgi:ubiquinone/menaquinone biosynthesis C-methylase UbiE
VTTVRDFDIRQVTHDLAEEPQRWDEVRPVVKQLFDNLAPDWDSRVGPHHVELLDAALRSVPTPSVALDLGTGTGVGATALIRHFPEATVVGADIAERMVRIAAAKQRPGEVRFVVADGARLPFLDASLDLVVALNVFLFFSELARVLRPGGRLAVLYSLAERTPIFLPPQELHGHLEAAGFGDIHEARAAKGVFHVASRERDATGGSS